MPLQTRDDLWAAIHAERAALAEDLAGLSDEQWATPSSCGRWTVEQVVAHLTAAASTGGFRGPSPPSRSSSCAATSP